MSFAMKYIIALVFLVLFSLVFQFSQASEKPQKPKGTMPHNIREITFLDDNAIEKMVSDQIDSNEKDDGIFLDQAAKTLATVVFIHPGFSAREAGISRAKSLMLSEDFPIAVKRATNILIPLAQSSNPVDSATALEGLKNIVIEAKHLSKPEMKPVLQKIAAAHLEVSDEAREYGQEPLENLVSPSEAAKTALN